LRHFVAMERSLAAVCTVLLGLSWLCFPAQSAPLPRIPSSQTDSKDSSTSSKTTRHKTSHRTRHHRRVAKKRGQQKIDSDRTRDIQEALIRQHYLSGEPSGKWDSATQSALQRYQADNGWQTKVTPDSRALIKLGLGPDQGHLLNPETAMTSQPIKPAGAADVAKTKPAAKASGSLSVAGATQAAHANATPASATPASATPASANSAGSSRAGSASGSTTASTSVDPAPASAGAPAEPQPASGNEDAPPQK
jgi:Putative peptidoglycan binding domain